MPSKNKKKHPNKKKRDVVAANSGHRTMHDRARGISLNSLPSDATTLLDKLQPGCSFPAEECREIVRKLLIMSGTDVEMNDKDPYGDGDQSLVGAGEDYTSADPRKLMKANSIQQILRSLFNAGGDLESHLRGGLSPFARACCLGNASAVEQAIKQTAEDSEERMHLLERRETGMRLTPLLLAVAISKCKPYACGITGTNIAAMNHMKVVKLLLQYGARPDCKEASGKTMVHYCAGSYATEESLKMSEYAIEASKTSAHFGKRVFLKNLSKIEYNGKVGKLGWFMPENGRRQVTLDGGNKQLALLPKNIFPFAGVGNEEEACIYDGSRKLVNDYDRLGNISMHEVIMSERVDVAKFLIKQGQSVDIAPVCGMTIRKMASRSMPHGVSTMISVIRKYIVDLERVERNRCHGCREVFNEKLKNCSRCRKTFYCSTECQTKHWRAGHKTECKVLNEDYSIQLSPPNYSESMSRNLVIGSVKELAYKKPDGVDIDERFWIKVQVNEPTSPHLVYDKSRSCAFYIMPGTSGHLVLHEKVRSEKSFEGTKCYFKAAFDESGICRVYLNQTAIKKW
mmetsp:Transcript_2551/g.3720  ORF Transcript_2551/g.3720 Transcript_2551/m.3720 type:complete len:569 (+) Transcript_2551:145-1851(+)